MELAAGPEAPRPSAAEEEAVKRNTDCVYFLASPLTCKKGNKCEFRHSESARFNPRDCWYWLNSNCLNPKCTFRHPPLDGLIGAQGNTSSALPSLQTTVSMPNSAVQTSANNTNKQIVPCYYFQKGQCLKGERCPFIHGSQASISDLSPASAMASVSHDEPLISVKDIRGTNEYRTQGTHLQQIVPKVYLNRPRTKPVEPTKVPVSKITTADNNMHTSNLGHLQNKSPVHVTHSLRKTQIHERLHSGAGKETGKFGDSPPGGVRASDSFDNQGNLRRLTTRDGRNLNPEDDLERKPNGYKMMTKLEKVGYDIKSEQNQNGQLKHVYVQEQTTSSHKISARSLHSERRMVQRASSSIEIDGSDLRHRLLKQKRLNSSRSARSPDHDGKHYPRDNHDSEEKKHSHRDQKQASYQSSISNRLRGRINFPQRSKSPEIPAKVQFEGERDKGLIGQVSPVRSLNHQGGHNRTINQRLDEYLPKVARSNRSQTAKEEDVSLNFAGPKSLAEIKRVRSERNVDDTSTKNAHAVVPSVLKRSENVDEILDTDNSISFEGPKSLSTILKRKREIEYSDGGEHRQQDKRVLVETSISRTVPNSQMSLILEAKKEVKDDVNSAGGRFIAGEKQEHEEEDEEGTIPTEEEELMYVDHPADQGDVVDDDYGMELDTMQDQEPESYEQGDAELDYDGLEQAEEANTSLGDEDEFDYDDDDFARKLGIMHS